MLMIPPQQHHRQRQRRSEHDVIWGELYQREPFFRTFFIHQYIGQESIVNTNGYHYPPHRYSNTLTKQDERPKPTWFVLFLLGGIITK